MIGDLHKLKMSCLRNPPGTVGVVFNVYDGGIQVIFPNGEYDGFNTEAEHTDYNLFLEPYGFCEACSDYVFKNVMQVTLDFEKGYWRPALEDQL